MKKIAVDLKGADRPQEELLPGVIRALSSDPSLYINLLGDESVLLPLLDEAGVSPDRYRIIDSPDEVSNHDNPADVIRSKSNSSLMKGIMLCREDPEIGAYVSCGPTGALFVASIMVLGRIPHVTPVLLCEIIRDDGNRLCIADCGANIDCSEERLLTFARLGQVFMQTRGTKEPKIALLSNGSEPGKGNELVKKAYQLLEAAEDLDFIGNLEGTQVYSTEADVLVCEGFAGNILLKSLEGAAKSAVAHARKAAEMLEEPARSVMLSELQKVYDNYDYNSLGGAVLVGTNTPVVKGHGSADATTLFSIITIAAEIADNHLSDRVREKFA
ncbi:MAG: phosphate acyltransferase [Lachnospiraceae bacterium]|nr:phosphate acyltransferase [Lachnospiraceae bacterium]